MRVSDPFSILNRHDFLFKETVLPSLQLAMTASSSPSLLSRLWHRTRFKGFSHLSSYYVFHVPTFPFLSASHEHAINYSVE